MRQLLVILFICTVCTGAVYAQEKPGKKNDKGKSNTPLVTDVSGVQRQMIKDTVVTPDLGKQKIDIGYTSQREDDITGSVSSVDTKGLTTGGYTNIFDYLQGRVAGLTVTNDPSNSSGYSITIRGINSFHGSTEPLVVINGTPANGLDALSALSPNDVKSISVLKDASAAIYGVRGANGVILITTK